MVVRTSVPAGLQLFSPVEVAVECDGAAVVVAGQVLQIFPGIGVAVGFERTARDRIEALASRGPVTEPTDADVELSARLARGTSKPSEAMLPRTLTGEEPAEPRREVAQGSNPAIDRIQLALRGDRDQRMEILRGKNRALHVYVLRNPAVTFDEICAIARMPTVNPEVLTQIAERREWGHRPEVAMSLVRNPAVPVPAAIRLLDHVSVNDLRQLAKDARTREPIQRAARKKLLA